MSDTKTSPYYLAFQKVAYRKYIYIPDLLLIEMNLFNSHILPHKFSINDIWWILGEFRMYYPCECRPCKVNNATGNIDFENKTYCLDSESENYHLTDYRSKILLNSTKYIMIKLIRK